MMSVKKSIITGYIHSNDIEELNQNKLIILTAGGIVVGTPVSEEKSVEGKVLSTIRKASLDNYTQKGGNIPADGNDGFFSLQDVIILNGAIRTPMPFLDLFYDQIIGITIGNVE